MGRAIGVCAAGALVVGCAGERDAAVERTNAAESAAVFQITAAADTYLRSGPANQNQGALATLRLRQAGENRSLVAFDQAAIVAAIGASANLAEARIDLRIADNLESWGKSGRLVGIHRMTAPWTELGATWNCADDANTANSKPDCPLGAWQMGAPQQWVAAPSSTVLVTNGSSGVISFDVTADVRAFLDGAPNDGWLLRKLDEDLPGRLELASRESATPPVLVLTKSAADPCANVLCVAVDACHVAGVCDPSTGTCSNPEAPNGASCDDGDSCTSSDVCTAGTCAGVAPDLASDSANCGACGHDCLGGACTSGACGPVALADALYNPSAIALDDGDVYWAELNGGAVRRVAKSGGAYATLKAGLAAPNGVVVADGTVWFTNQSFNDPSFGEVWSVPAAGGPATLLSSGEPSPQAIVVDDVNVYWANAAGTGSVYSMPRGGGARTLVASSGWVFDMAIRDGFLFFSDDSASKLRKVATSGGPITNLDSGVFNAYVAVDDAWVWMAMRPYGYVAKVAVGGGPEIPISTTATGLSDVALDETYAYWTVQTASSASIVRMAKAGGPTTTMFTMAATPTTRINQLAVDDHFVFFTVNGYGDGKVMRVVK